MPRVLRLPDPPQRMECAVGARGKSQALLLDSPECRLSDKNVLKVSFHLPSSTNHAASINRTEDCSALLPRLRWNSQFTSALFLGNCQGVIKQEANCWAAALKGGRKTPTQIGACMHTQQTTAREIKLLFESLKIEWVRKGRDYQSHLPESCWIFKEQASDRVLSKDCLKFLW